MFFASTAAPPTALPSSDRSRPGLVEFHKKLDETIQQRLSTAVPLSWASALLVIALGVLVIYLFRTGTITEGYVGGLVFVAGSLLLSLGIGLAIGATQRQGGVWWAAPLLAALALIPVAGLIVIGIVMATNTSPPGQTAAYKRRVERPMLVGMFLMGVMFIVAGVFTSQ